MGKKDTIDKKDKETDSERYIPIKRNIAGLDVINPTARRATKRYYVD